jgi:lipopolysaccharide/colanic/teichoic acid biosynthesis glycosyltransferase
LDLRYVENWSRTLDLVILWKTISAVLARRGLCKRLRNPT